MKWQANLTEDKQNGNRFYSLDYELFHLVCGMFSMLRLKHETLNTVHKVTFLKNAKEHLDKSLGYAKRCSQRPHIPGSYLAMARYYIMTEEWILANKHITKALSFSIKGDFDLRSIDQIRDNLYNGTYWSWVIDALVLKTEISVLRKLEDSQELLSISSYLIKQTGYKRRSRDIDELNKLSNTSFHANIKQMNQISNSLTAEQLMEQTVPLQYKNTYPEANTKKMLYQREDELDMQPTVTIQVQFDTRSPQLLALVLAKNEIVNHHFFGQGQYRVPADSIDFLASFKHLTFSIVKSKFSEA